LLKGELTFLGRLVKNAILLLVVLKINGYNNKETHFFCEDKYSFASKALSSESLFRQIFRTIETRWNDKCLLKTLKKVEKHWVRTLSFDTNPRESKSALNCSLTDALENV